MWHYDVVLHSASTKFDFLSHESASDWLAKQLVLAISHTVCNLIRNILCSPLIVCSWGLAGFRLLYNSILVARGDSRRRFDAISAGTRLTQDSLSLSLSHTRAHTHTLSLSFSLSLSLLVCVPVTVSNNVKGKWNFLATEIPVNKPKISYNWRLWSF